jgi:hypothetical protein
MPTEGLNGAPSSCYRVPEIKVRLECLRENRKTQWTPVIAKARRTDR